MDYQDNAFEAQQAVLNVGRSPFSTASSHTIVGESRQDSQLNTPASDSGSEAATSATMSANGDQGDTIISAEERIRELNQVDMEVVHMLKAMGRAVQVLSADESEPLTIDQRKEIFQQNVRDAVSRLATIDVIQRRSIYALAESGIIESDHGHSSKNPPPPALGSLDLSMLNGQNDRIGKQIEAEQWAKVRELLENLQASSFGSYDANGAGTDEQMQP